MVTDICFDICININLIKYNINTCVECYTFNDRKYCDQDIYTCFDWKESVNCEADEECKSDDKDNKARSVFQDSSRFFNL